MTRIRTALLFLRWRFCELRVTSDGFTTPFLRSRKMIFMYVPMNITPGSHCVAGMTKRSVFVFQVLSDWEVQWTRPFLSVLRLSDSAKQKLVKSPIIHETITRYLAKRIVIWRRNEDQKLKQGLQNFNKQVRGLSGVNFSCRTGQKFSRWA